jgi:hypothetical protein
MSDDTLSVFLNIHLSMNENFHALVIELNLGGCNYKLFKKEFSQNSFRLHYSNILKEYGVVRAKIDYDNFFHSAFLMHHSHFYPSVTCNMTCAAEKKF